MERAQPGPGGSKPVIRVDNPLSCTVPTLPEGPGASKDSRQEQERAWRREMERAQLAAWLSHGVVGGGKNAPAPTAHLLAPTASTGDATAAEGGGFANWRAVSPSPSAAALGAADTPSQGARASAAAKTTEPGGSPAARENSRQRAPAASDVPLTPSWPTPDRMAAAKPAVPAGPLAAVEAGAALGLEIQPDLFVPFALHGGEPEGMPRAGRQEQIAPVHRVSRPEADGGVRQPVRIHAQWTPEGVHLWLALDAGVLAHQDAIVQQVRRWVLAQGARVLSLSCNARPLTGGGERELPSAENSIDNNVEVKEAAWPSVR